ncbi:MAG TPA: hypothetical protein VL049_11240 [Candidatus Dormibacteraeota bacterium]|nr:hypothetical protein [Candidatus Dormibacteraeota bacterium]
MTRIALRLLAVVALAALLSGTARAGVPNPVCCVCDCPGALQCTSAASAVACDPILAACNNAANNSCLTAAVNGSCAAFPECALTPASAPLLDVTGLAIAVIALGGLAALRLRRPARQRSQQQRRK